YLLTIMASITISLEKGKASLTYGSGEIDSELREVESFHSIRVKGSIDLFLTQAPEQSVRIEAEENILPLITTEVADGMLTIRHKGSFFTKTEIKTFISIPDIREIRLDGSGDAIAETTIVSERLTLALN